MKYVTILMIVMCWIAGLMIGGCTSDTVISEIQYQTIAVESGDTVRFSMDEGLIRFVEKEDGPIEISGKIVGQFSWKETNDGVEIMVENGRNGGSDQSDTELEIKIPKDVVLDISTFDADIILENINGQVKAVSVAGNVTADGLAGNIILKSGRGNVQAVSCEGRIRVLGEHGVLQMIDLHGDIASATIMGTVNFSGSIGEGDDVFLETDHGPVLVTMREPVNMQVKAWTASGEVACMLDGLEQTVDGCVGIVGSDVPGKLTVKTVSGKIWMERSP